MTRIKHEMKFSPQKRDKMKEEEYLKAPEVVSKVKFFSSNKHAKNVVKNF